MILHYGFHLVRTNALVCYSLYVSVCLARRLENLWISHGIRERLDIIWFFTPESRKAEGVGETESFSLSLVVTKTHFSPPSCKLTCLCHDEIHRRLLIVTGTLIKPVTPPSAALNEDFGLGICHTRSPRKRRLVECTDAVYLEVWLYKSMVNY